MASILTGKTMARYWNLHLTRQKRFISPDGGGVGGDEAGDQFNTGAGDTLVPFSLEPDEYLSLGGFLVPRMTTYDDRVRYNKGDRHVDALKNLRRVMAQFVIYHPSDRPSLQELGCI